VKKSFLAALLLALLPFVGTQAGIRTYPPAGLDGGVGGSGPLPDELLLPFGNHATLSNGLNAYWSLDDGGAGPGEVGGFTFTTNGTVASAAAKVGNGASITYGSWLSLAHNATIGIGETGNGASISMWANSSGSDDSAPFLAWAEGAFTPSIGLYYNAGNVRLLVSDDTFVTKNVFSGFSYTFWHHLVATFGEGGDNKARLYVDGVLVATSTATATGTLESMAGFDMILGATFGGVIAMTVIVDETGLWDRPLTAAEVTYLFNGGAGRAY
jgi:Concanavalin A-like lectin/glucanases superfamily